MDGEPVGKDVAVWGPRGNLVVQLADFCQCIPCPLYCRQMGFYMCATISLLLFFDQKLIGTIGGPKVKVDFDGSGPRWERCRSLVAPKKFSCTTCRFFSMHSLPLVLHRNGLLYVCHNFCFVLFRLKARRHDWGFESEGRFRWIGSQVGRMSEFGRLEEI